MYSVKPIARNDCAEFILEIHYAKRWPSISYAYGLFLDDVLVGVVTYGTPFSTTLRLGVAGTEYAVDVLELNRLCLRNNVKNEASILVGRSLQQLPKGKIIISYADTSQGHTGTVYQATNFIYTGLSAKRTDWTVKGMEHLHGQTISDQFRGQKNRAQAARDYYGEAFYLKPRPRKHRYIKIIGSKHYIKKVTAALKYPITDYPTKEQQA
jgi:hypothetical protein